MPVIRIEYDNKKVDHSNCEAIINKARGCLTVDALKELRIPKSNAFSYVKTTMLNQSLQENLDLQTDVLKSINNKTNTINTSVQEGRRSLNKLEKNNKVNKLCMCGIITAVIITTCVIIVLLLI